MPDLYVIENEKQLIEKTISMAIMNRFANPLIITTTDGGIMMWRTDCSEDEDMVETNIYTADMVESLVFSSNRMKAWLLEKKVCTQVDIDKFVVKQVERRKIEAEERHKQLEKDEKAQFDRLKAKYGDGR